MNRIGARIAGAGPDGRRRGHAVRQPGAGQDADGGRAGDPPLLLPLVAFGLARLWRLDAGADRRAAGLLGPADRIERLRAGFAHGLQRRLCRGAGHAVDLAGDAEPAVCAWAVELRVPAASGTLRPAPKPRARAPARWVCRTRPAARRATPASSAWRKALPIATAMLRSQRSWPMRRIGLPSVRRRNSSSRPAEQLGQLPPGQALALVEVRQGAAPRELVPGADQLAVVAAVDAVAHQRPQFLGNRARDARW